MYDRDVDLKHEPDEGVSIESDLSRTTVTLTRLRGAPVLFTMLLLTVLAIANGIVGSDIWSYVFPLFLMVSAVLNAVKTEVDLGPRAVTIRTLWFGRERACEVVPYDSIREITAPAGSYSGPRLQITRIDGSTVSIPHGTAEDLAELHRALDARRPIQPLPDPASAAPPAAIQRMRNARHTRESS